MATSLAWHMRNTSPASTRCESSVAPVASSSTRIVPSAGATKVLSCDPYSSACCAMRPTFGTLPIVAGLRAPFFLQSSMIVR